MPKKIAVLGGGNGAHMMAADMKLRGHEVRMYEMPEFAGTVEQLMATKTIKISGIMKEEVQLDAVSSDIDEVINGVDYILIATPAFAHESYARLLKGRVKAEQVIVVFPGAFAGLVFRNILGDEDVPVIADANNLPYDVRLVGPAHVELFGHNRINIAFFPAERSSELVETLRADLYPFEKVYSDVLECGLGIVNPALHTGPCLFNISNIESPTVNFYLYEHGFTPSAAKLDIVLDNERKAVGRRFGYNLTPIEDFSGLEEGYTWQELYQATHGAISLTPICGPNDINNRYLTEDAPFGLVPWAAVASAVGVEMPITNSIIDIYNIIHETDWRARGNGIEKLGIDGMSPEGILEYVRTGKR